MGGVGWIAAATLAPAAGAVVVVVVVGEVLDRTTTSREPSVGTLVGANGGEVGGVTVLGPGSGALVVVVEAGVGAVDVPWCCFSGLSGAVARSPGASRWPAVAATKARRETATARTAHQCGRMRRAGSEPSAPLCELSLATA